jgi:hypothetical protein
MLDSRLLVDYRGPMLAIRNALASIFPPRWTAPLPPSGALVLNIKAEIFGVVVRAAGTFKNRTERLEALQVLRFDSVAAFVEGFEVDSIRRSIALSQFVGLIEIDGDGCEAELLLGVQGTIDRDKPNVIVPGDNSEAVKLLESWGYDVRRLDSSPNVIATARAAIIPAICSEGIRGKSLLPPCPSTKCL